MFGTITEQTLPPTDTWLQVSNPPSGWTATEGEGYEQARFSTHDTLGRSPGVRTETVGSQGSPAGMSQASQSDLQPIPARASGQNTVLVKSQSLSKRMRHMYY
jgi:hypothetical protein